MIFKKKAQPSIKPYVITAAIGVTAGAVLGLLFAPKKGWKMRRAVANNFKALPSKLPFRGSAQKVESDFLVN